MNMNKLLGVIGIVAAVMVGIFMLDAHFKESIEFENTYSRVMVDIIEKNHTKIFSTGHVVYKNKNNNIAGCVHVEDNILKKSRTFRFTRYRHSDEIEIRESPCELIIAP